MNFGSVDNGGNDERNGNNYVEISTILVMQDGFFFGMIPYGL